MYKSKIISDSVSLIYLDFICSLSNIFNAIKKEFLLLKIFMVRYDTEFKDCYKHKNKKVMVGNSNADKYEYILTYQEEIYTASSLRKLLLITKHLHTTRRSIENCIANKKEYLYKVTKNEK